MKEEEKQVYHCYKNRSVPPFLKQVVEKYPAYFTHYSLKPEFIKQKVFRIFQNIAGNNSCVIPPKEMSSQRTQDNSSNETTEEEVFYILVNQQQKGPLSKTKVMEILSQFSDKRQILIKNINQNRLLTGDFFFNQENLHNQKSSDNVTLDDTQHHLDLNLNTNFSDILLEQHDSQNQTEDSGMNQMGDSADFDIFGQSEIDEEKVFSQLKKDQKIMYDQRKSNEQRDLGNLIDMNLFINQSSQNSHNPVNHQKMLEQQNTIEQVLFDRNSGDNSKPQFNLNFDLFSQQTTNIHSSPFCRNQNECIDTYGALQSDPVLSKQQKLCQGRKGINQQTKSQGQFKSKKGFNLMSTKLSQKQQKKKKKRKNKKNHQNRNKVKNRSKQFHPKQNLPGYQMPFGNMGYTPQQHQSYFSQQREQGYQTQNHPQQFSNSNFYNQFKEYQNQERFKDNFDQLDQSVYRNNSYNSYNLYSQQSSFQFQPQQGQGPYRGMYQTNQSMNRFRRSEQPCSFPNMVFYEEKPHSQQSLNFNPNLTQKNLQQNNYKKHKQNKVFSGMKGQAKQQRKLFNSNNLFVQQQSKEETSFQSKDSFNYPF